MKLTQELEFVWRGSKSLGQAAQMFTHVMDSHYCTPKGFDWEHGVTQDLPQGDGYFFINKLRIMIHNELIIERQYFIINK